MSRLKVGAIGFLITLSFISCNVAIFTKEWITWNVNGYYAGGVGILPYRSGEPGWFAASTWMMFISLGLFFPLFLVYLHAAYKVYRHGCCHSIRRNFSGIFLLCFLIVLFQAVTFLLTSINASHYGYYENNVVNSSPGYSAYLFFVTGGCATLAASLAEIVSRQDCH